MRASSVALLAGLALAVVGCGGGESSATTAEGAASIVPASAALYASIATDLDSEQINQLEELLAKFPDSGRLLDQVTAELSTEDVDWSSDVKPALGDVLDIVALELRAGDPPVLILQPGDEDKLQELLRKGDNPPVSTEIDGWTVIAEDQAALDQFEQARSQGTLAGDAAFEGAMAGLPEEAVAEIYVNGAAATAAAEREGGVETDERNQVKAFAAALVAEPNGLRLDGKLTTELEPDLAGLEPYEPTLLEAAPEDALAFLSGNGHGKIAESLDHVPGVAQQLNQVLGTDAEGLIGLFEGEFALWVAPGLPIPEVTFLAEAGNGEQALTALDRVAGLLAASANAERRTTEIDGVQAHQVVAQGVTVTYAAFDGKVILTTRPGAIADARAGGDSLADNPEFQETVEAAGMPDTAFGFLYADIEQLSSLIEGFSGLAGQEVPPELARNLDPLGSLLLYAAGDPEDLKLSAFLAIE